MTRNPSFIRVNLVGFPKSHVNLTFLNLKGSVILMWDFEIPWETRAARYRHLARLFEILMESHMKPRGYGMDVVQWMLYIQVGFIESCNEKHLKQGGLK